MNKHLMVVDDEAPTRDMMALYFSSRGYLVSTASTSDELMDISEQNRPDLMILDIDLGENCSLDVLPLLRQRHPSMPVVIFTGLTDDHSLIERAQKANISGYLRKTQPLSQMLDLIKTILPD